MIWLRRFSSILATFSSRVFHPFRFPDFLRERRRKGVASRNGGPARDFSQMTLQETTTELERAAAQSRLVFIETLRALASASDNKDFYTRGHSERVTRFSVEIAKAMGLPEDEIERIRIGALIHDIGKIAIDSDILNKPTLLTDAEYAVMKTHTTRGCELLGHIPLLHDIVPGIRYHHEQIDGKGYPHGLKGEEIPMIARVIAVADCFDAMTTTRPYQDPAPVGYVLGMIRSAAGIKYDVRVVEALVQGVKMGRIIARSEDKTR
jgi:HD-GYP domain-containing protein (c-di-GMP phosphodiesterase class II)